MSRLAATLAGEWPKVDYAPPRYRTIPTEGKRQQELEHYAVYLAGEAGLMLDPWEEHALLDSLRMRPDGKWGALEVGICVSRQNGKGHHELSTEILTLSGWKTIGSLRRGDYVFDSDGRPTRVSGKSDIHLGERCHEVSFADGSQYVVGENHLWHVYDTGGYDAEVYALATGTRREKIRAGVGGGVWTVLSTRDLADSRWAQSRYDEKYERTKTAYRYRVRCDAVPQTPDANLPIDPYAFGLWLGDGSKDSGRLTCGDVDRAYMRQALVDARLEVYAETRGNNPWKPWRLIFRIPGTRWQRNGFIGQLRQLGVYGNKHIPDCYLTASPAQRLALLQGLMDTDGSIGGRNKSPQVEFSSSVPALARDFHVLARSLGIRVTPKWRETSRKPNCRFLWTPTFNPFRLPRKAEKYRAPSVSHRRADRMAITDIREVPSVPVQCIQVEAEDGVYLVGRHFTPTHNSILEARELVALYADERKFPGVGARLTVHSAHEAKTSHEGFERLHDLIMGCPRLRARVSGKPRQSEGSEVIRLLNGRRIRFRTRVSGGGRGLSGDLLIFDEAMILAQSIHEAVWPIVTARPNPQIWYTGSAVDQRQPLMDINGVVFSRIRHRGIEGDADLAYTEWSLEYESPDEVPLEVARDPDAWERTNPGLDVRLSRRVIAVEQRSLSARGFARERLGVGDWPDPEGNQRVIDEAKWAAMARDETSVMLDPVCFAVDVSPDRKRGALAVAGRNASGSSQMEVIERFHGTDGLIEAVKKLCTRRNRRTEVIVDVVGAGASLIPALEQERINVQPVTGGDHARGCGMVFDGIDQGTLNHLNDPALNAAVAGAVKRTLGERWAWDRTDSSVDISPLVACTLALFGLHRKRHGAPEIVTAEDLLGENDDAVFVASGLPPLDPEDL